MFEVKTNLPIQKVAIGSEFVNLKRLAEAAKNAVITGAVLLIAAAGIWGLFDTINQTLATGVIP